MIPRLRPCRSFIAGGSCCRARDTHASFERCRTREMQAWQHARDAAAETGSDSISGVSRAPPRLQRSRPSSGAAHTLSPSRGTAIARHGARRALRSPRPPWPHPQGDGDRAMTRSARSDIRGGLLPARRAWTTVRDSNGKQRMVSDDSASGIELTHPGVVPSTTSMARRGETTQRLIVPTEWLSHARQFGDCTGLPAGIAGTAEPILQRLRQSGGVALSPARATALRARSIARTGSRARDAATAASKSASTRARGSTPERASDSRASPSSASRCSGRSASTRRVSAS